MSNNKKFQMEVLRFIETILQQLDEGIDTLKKKKAVMSPTQFQKELGEIIGQIKAYSMMNDFIKKINIQNDDEKFVVKGRDKN